MVVLLSYLALALGVSFLCSIMEAVLLSVTPGFAAAFDKTEPRHGALLRELKADIDRPLAAILCLNTIAHTAGAAGVGAQALVVFGHGSVAVTSALLTFLILVLSEIIPKTLGAVYWRRLVIPTARLIHVLIRLLYPLVYLSQLITRWISRGASNSAVSREEIRALAEIGFRQGIFHEQESRILRNLLRLRNLRAHAVMTPRPVLFTLSAKITVGQVMADATDFRFSRIPIYEKHRDDIHSYVLCTDILLQSATKHSDKPLRDLGRRILVVPESAPLIYLFEQMLAQREPIALVVDEYGGVAGLLTMEDIVETLLGVEIVDETDAAEDMQELARRQWAKRAQSLGILQEEGKDAGESP